MARNLRSDICIISSSSLFLGLGGSILSPALALVILAVTVPIAIATVPNEAAAQCDSVRTRTVNIMDFGAIGDGMTDDSAAFQMAVDCLAHGFDPDQDQRAGAVLVVPGGRYRLDMPVRLTVATAAPRGQGLTIRGQGPTRSEILGTSRDGSLQLHIAANRPWFNFFVTIRDIGFVAGVSGAGAAIELIPIQASSDDNVPKVTAAFRNVSISASGDGNFFDYGVKGAHLLLPLLEQVHMNTSRKDRPNARACFFFEDSYGVIVDDSSCDGAEVGVSIPRSAEGNTIEHSRFSNVDTAIEMEVVPGKGGPSSSGGKISNNYIEARKEGIVIDSKTWFTVSDNVLAGPAGSAATDIVLRDTQKVIVAGNRFVGGGRHRTGIAVLRGGKPWPRAGSDMVVSKNIFGPLATGIRIGKGVSNTLVQDNRLHARAAIDDKGSRTSAHNIQIDDRLSCRLAAWPPAVAEGAPATLVWDTEGAESGAIDSGVGAMDPLAFGSHSLRAGGSTTFIARVRDAAGHEASCSTTLQVTKPLGFTDEGGTIMDVKLFGAVGDGLTDDTRSIESAVESLVKTMDADGAATLYFPPGTYRISGVIALRQSSKAWGRLVIRGEGPSVSTIVTKANAGIFDLRFSAQVPTEIADLKLVSETDDAGTAISVSMPPGSEAARSLVVRDMRINGDETSRTAGFSAAIRGIGLSNPLFQNLRMTGYYIGTGFGPMRRSGEACILLRDGWGLEMRNAYCTNMRDGFDIVVRGGDIKIWRGQALAVVPETGVRINAGGGDVTIDAAHVNAGTWNFDIGNANNVVIANTLTLNQDRDGELPGHGSIRVREARRVIIDNNMFNQAGPLCPPPGNKSYLCFQENRDRTSVSIGPEVGGAAITGNIFNEPGVGVRLPADAGSARITGNVFLKPSTEVDRR